MRTFLIILSVGMFQFLGAQTLDLAIESIELISPLHHMSGDKGMVSAMQPAHIEDAVKMIPISIRINTMAKTIKISELDSDSLKYDLSYSMSHQGTGDGSVALRPSETMFMVRDEEIFMVTHDKVTETLHVITNENKIELFGNLQFRVDYDAKIEEQKAKAKQEAEEKKRAQELLNFESR
jgi:hypothetical protein